MNPSVSNLPGKPLTPQETVELNRCETVIQRGLESFVEVGQALIKIRDERLYRQQHGSFKAYVLERWGMTARHAYRQCDGAEIFRNLLPAKASASPDPEVTNWSPLADGLPLPKSESQVRPLKGLKPSEQRQAWKEAVAASRGHVTAKDVQKVVAEQKKWPKPNEHGVFDEKSGERFDFKHRSAHAELFILQIGKDKWISTFNFKHQTGSLSGRRCPLSARQVFTHRSYAIKEAAGDLMQSQRSIIMSRDSGPEQKRIAQRISDWAMEFVRGERGQPKPAEFVRSSNSRAKEITLEVERSARPKAKEVKLLQASDRAIKDVQELLELTGMGAYRNVYLNIALERLEKFRETLQNSRRSMHDGRHGL